MVNYMLYDYSAKKSYGSKYKAKVPDNTSNPTHQEPS
jgi:hypothetical protein